jgi:hypothetical protein
LRQFVVANPPLLSLGGSEGAVWDAVMEAFVTAGVAPAVEHEWVRPAGWPKDCSPQQAARQQRAAAAGLRRLGWLPAGVSLPNTTAAKEALGCNDKDDVHRVEMIFPWEVFESPAPATAPLWEVAARALVVLAVILGGRPGAVTALLYGHVRRTSDDEVLVVQQRGFRHKPQRERATRRGRRTAPALTVQHWAIARDVQPWLQWLRSQHTPDSQLLFPSLYARRMRGGAPRRGDWWQAACGWNRWRNGGGGSWWRHSTWC